MKKFIVFLVSIILLFSCIFSSACAVRREEEVVINNTRCFLNEDKMKFPTLIIYSLWIGLGTQILLYLGAMNNISDGVLEAAQLDGVSPIREFFSIVLPQIFPTITVFVCTGLSSIFINQLNLYTFYVRKADPELYTVGYYMYRKLVMSTSFSNYPYVAAMGILVTLVTTPTVLLVRKLLNRVDPMGG